MSDTNPDNGSAKMPEAQQETQKFAFFAMTFLFFFWGFITVLNDLLIPFLKETYELSYTQASLVQFCFFGAYFIISPIANRIIDKFGFQMGLVIGLVVTASGCFLFYPSATLNIYILFLGSLFILGSGITILQVAANPYVSALGPESTAASRLNAAQFANSFATWIAPLLLSGLILGMVGVGASVVQMPYLIMGVILVAAAGLFKFIKLPKLAHVEAGEGDTSSSLTSHIIFSAAIIAAMAFGLTLVAGLIVLVALAYNFYGLRQYRSMVLGALAIFLYVGGEVAIGSFLVDYFAESTIAGMAKADAGEMIAYYWGGAMVGRFFGALLMNYVAATKYLVVNAFMAILMIIVSMNSSGDVAVYSILLVGFFNSIMFPTIFTLAVKGLGSMTSKGSALVCQGIVGGALIPVLQGGVADSIGLQMSFIIPMLCYVYIAWYAMKGTN